MKADYKNWVPNGMIYGFGAAAAGLAAVAGIVKNRPISALLLRETLRVLKKGCTFAIHDLMEPARYGDMEEFVALRCQSGSPGQGRSLHR